MEFIKYFKKDLIRTLKIWAIVFAFAILVPLILVIADYFYRLATS